MKSKIMISLIIALTVLNLAQFLYTTSFRRLYTDAIPDEETALAVGEAVLLASPYKEMIYEGEPFLVFFDKLKKHWIVYGGWPNDPNLVGIVAGVELRMSDGKVMGFLFPN